MKKITYAITLFLSILFTHANADEQANDIRVLEGSRGMFTSEHWILAESSDDEVTSQFYYFAPEAELLASVIKYKAMNSYDQILLSTSETAKEGNWTVLDFGEISESPKTFLLEYTLPEDDSAVEYIYIIEKSVDDVVTVIFRAPSVAYKKGLFNKVVSQLE